MVSTRGSGVNPIRADFNLASRARRDVTFFFDVPSLVPSGTTVCTQIQAGVNPSPLFNMVRRKSLFCIRKVAASFEVMSVEEPGPLDLMKSQGVPPPQPSK